MGYNFFVSEVSGLGLLDRSAMKRAEKQLAGALEAGEHIIEFDLGKNPKGIRLDCIATNRALYVVPPGGAAMRLPYNSIRQAGGGRSSLSLSTLAGSEYTFDFGRAPRGLTDVVVERFRAEAQRRRRFHVSWGQGGGTFLVVPDGARWSIDSWRYDEGVEDDVNTSMLFEQALGELEVHLGLPPSMQHEDPRPPWMPSFEWEPLLR